MLAACRKRYSLPSLVFFATLLGMLWAGSQFHVHKPGWNTAAECLFCDLEKTVSSGAVPMHAADIVHVSVICEVVVALATRLQTRTLPAFSSRAPPLSC